MTLWNLLDLDKIIEKFKDDCVFTMTSTDNDSFHDYPFFSIIINGKNKRGWIINKKGEHYSPNEFFRLNNMKIFW